MSVPADLAQRDHDPDARQQAQLLEQERLTPLHLEDRRLVGRGRAPHGGRDVSVDQLETVSGIRRRRLAGHALLMERPEQPVPAAIAGEHTSGAVAAVRRGRQPHQQHARRGIAESGKRSRPVLLARVARRRMCADRLAMTDQSRTAMAGDDASGEIEEARLSGGADRGPWTLYPARPREPGCGRSARRPSSRASSARTETRNSSYCHCRSVCSAHWEWADHRAAATAWRAPAEYRSLCPALRAPGEGSRAPCRSSRPGPPPKPGHAPPCPCRLGYTTWPGGKRWPGDAGGSRWGR